MKSLWLSSFLFIFFACNTSKSSKTCESMDSSFVMKNYFSSNGSTFQYKTDVTIYGRFFSGIIFIKFVDDTTCRIAFTTPPGAKLFEMQLTPHTSVIYEVIRQMDKAIIIKGIQKNIRMLIGLDNFISPVKRVTGLASGNEIILRKYLSDGFYQFYQGGSNNEIYKIELLNKKHKRKISLNAKEFENGIPNDVVIKNYNFKLTLHLTRL